MLEAIKAALSGAEPYDVEYRIVTPASGTRWLHSRGATTFDECGRPVRATGTALDITNQRNAEQALRASESKYRRLHDSMTDAFAKVDMSGKLVEFNEIFQRMLGYTAEELQALI
jgi:PAS domain-containing protein